MRLKKIRLAGFKSFVDPTNIPFPGDMTAVVGPNGCGKSNVIDAVRWVLGESSAKNLRGDAMTDVIFNGSSARKAVSQCSVELVFDNSSGRIKGEYAGYNELSVKRIVTKDAVSSYQLNASKCRRRDITDLFLGTGLGPRSYAIIEQGMISKLIESKPQELRVFIEEAAGISKYKERRKETLNRISHTKDNLTRLDDVRQELSDQLAKLKRQATAATRYKELKAQERELKGQLATVRWLGQSELLRKSDEIIEQYQQELNTLVSGKQGDESGLQALKNDQSVSKQKISDLQQLIYQMGNDITKLEQSQLFAKKRSAQIQSEVSQIMQQQQDIQLQVNSIAKEIEQSEAQILSQEPDMHILEEQLHELEDTVARFQEQQSMLAKSLKEIEQDYYQQKQSLQQKHSQLQQTLSLQQRTEARINELNQELAELERFDSSRQDELETQLRSLEEQYDTLHADHEKIVSCTEELKSKQNDMAHERQLASTQCIKLRAEIDALSALQQSDALSLPAYAGGAHNANATGDANAADVPNQDSDKKAVPVWQALSPKPGFEKVLESALSLFENALVVSGLDIAEVLQYADTQAHGQHALLFESNFTENSDEHERSEYKSPSSLAQFVQQSRVPSYFNDIFVAQNEAELAHLLTHLGSSQYVITKGGELYGKSLIVPYTKLGDGKVVRSARIAALKESLEQAEHDLSALEEEFAVLSEQVKRSEHDVQVSDAKLNENRNMRTLIARDIDNLKALQSQQEGRLARLKQDLTQQQETLSQEQMSSEILSEEIEDASIELAEIEAKKYDVESDQQGAQVQLVGAQTQYQQLQHKLHEGRLTTQRLQNSYQILQEQRKNKANQLQDNQDKIELLKEEAETLLMPAEDQQDKLQDMLAQKETLEAQLAEHQQELGEIEEKISTIEKGQVGINQKIDGIKQRIESERLSAQTSKVKAQSFVEQLAEMKLNVRDVLETLPEDAKENEYQSKLDAVQASLSRLGAVNLAAVEEYEEQAVRKQHLDDQNADLTQALDTLESAMRKIDKETRARFKHTFDQVNDDLKMLFPKVFGGGSAYLALTDDDLLDTGVTIMARPPGKKNSTIHLLSGGEKALTALSLVFAIFRLNPAPFCLLDEVDAPLDDANVGRFCKLVSEMSKTVQFIYITHNKVAMEMASHLTGVTMAEPGVSRMVSVDMEEALAIAQ